MLTWLEECSKISEASVLAHAMYLHGSTSNSLFHSDRKKLKKNYTSPYTAIPEKTFFASFRLFINNTGWINIYVENLFKLLWVIFQDFIFVFAAILLFFKSSIDSRNVKPNKFIQSKEKGVDHFHLIRSFTSEATIQSIWNSANRCTSVQKKNRKNTFQLNNRNPWYIDSRCHSHWHVIIEGGVGEGSLNSFLWSLRVAFAKGTKLNV